MIGAIRLAASPCLFWLKLAAAGAIVGLLIGGAYAWREHERDVGRAEVQAKFDAYVDEQQRVSAADSLRRFQGDKDAQDTFAADLRRARGARDAARTELGRLHDSLDDARARVADLTDAPERDDAPAAVALDLFGACAVAYEGVEGEVGELAAQLRGLQRWVSGVHGEPVIRPEGDRGDR